MFSLNESFNTVNICKYEVCENRNATGVTETLFRFEIKHHTFSRSKQSPSRVIHFFILFFHASMDPWKDSLGIAFSSMVTALLIFSTSPKWLLLMTSFSFGNRKKSQGFRFGEYGSCSSKGVLLFGQVLSVI